MSGRIPVDPSWCTFCVAAVRYGRPLGEPCENHSGPGGTRIPYLGLEAYEPSDYVKSVVGKEYAGGGGQFLCFGYDPRSGFWMRDVETGEERNFSERAIGRTYHEVRRR